MTNADNKVLSDIEANYSLEQLLWLRRYARLEILQDRDVDYVVGAMMSSFKNLFDIKAQAADVLSTSFVVANILQAAERELNKMRALYRSLQDQPTKKREWIYPEDFIHTITSAKLSELSIEVLGEDRKKLYTRGTLNDLELNASLRHKWHTVCIALLQGVYLDSSPLG